VASIRKVVHRTGRMSWQARWRDPAGSQHSKNFGRRIDAERFLITIEARKLAGTYIDPRAGRIRLGDFTEHAIAGWVRRWCRPASSSFSLPISRASSLGPRMSVRSRAGSESPTLMASIFTREKDAEEDALSQAPVCTCSGVASPTIDSLTPPTMWGLGFPAWI